MKKLTNTYMGGVSMGGVTGVGWWRWMMRGHVQNPIHISFTHLRAKGIICIALLALLAQPAIMPQQNSKQKQYE